MGYFELLGHGPVDNGDTWALRQAGSGSCSRARITHTAVQFGNFVGKLHSSNWAKMTKEHRDTVRRHIKDLTKKGILPDPGKAAKTQQIFNAEAIKACA